MSEFNDLLTSWRRDLHQHPEYALTETYTPAFIAQRLREMGVEVVELNCTPDGNFAHNPEPIPENLTEISARVPAEKADLGISYRSKIHFPIARKTTA